MRVIDSRGNFLRKPKSRSGSAQRKRRNTRRRRALVARDGPGCQDCRKFRGNCSALTIDHVIPKRDGGSNCLANLRLLCICCHRDVDNARPGGRYPEKVAT